MSFKKTIIAGLISAALVIPSTALSWVVERGFENTVSAARAPLEKTDGVQYFQDYNNRRVYITEVSKTGRRAIETRITTPYVNGKTALSVWAGGVGFGTGDTNYTPKEGEEVWGRVWVFFSPNWSWAPGKGSMLKIMRIYPSSFYNGELILQVDPGNSGAEYMGDIMAFTQNYVGGNIQLYGGTGRDASGTSVQIPIGRWFSLEGYLKVSTDPNKAMVRVWVDGNLVLERNGNSYGYTNRQTLNKNGSQRTLGSPGAVLFSTWDTDSSQSGPTIPDGSQYARFDDLIVTNEPSRAVATDKNGNKMIGPNMTSVRHFQIEAGHNEK